LGQAEASLSALSTSRSEISWYQHTALATNADETRPIEQRRKVVRRPAFAITHSRLEQSWECPSQPEQQCGSNSTTTAPPQHLRSTNMAAIPIGISNCHIHPITLAEWIVRDLDYAIFVIHRFDRLSIRNFLSYL
jgi:hypothetical protein